MTAIVLFLMLHIFALASFLLRDKLITGMMANNKIDDVRALAHWESKIIESKTAHEKMVYMRLADDIRAKLIDDVKSEIANSDFDATVFEQAKRETHQPTVKVKTDNQEPANSKVVSLADRRKAN